MTHLAFASLARRRSYSGAFCLLVVLSGAVAVGACGRRTNGPALGTEAPTATAAASNVLGATAIPSHTAAPAASAASGDLQWQVEVVENGQVLPEENGQVKLPRAPFTLRVILPDTVPVKLNALDSDANFVAIQPGFVFTADCMVALCTGMDVAEEKLNPQKTLFVDPLSTHYLYYNGPEDHRWSRAAFTGAGAVFERDVALLNDVPVEQFQGPALYLMFLVNRDNPDVIDPGELKKLILAFQ